MLNFTGASQKEIRELIYKKKKSREKIMNSLKGGQKSFMFKTKIVKISFKFINYNIIEK